MHLPGERGARALGILATPELGCSTGVLTQQDGGGGGQWGWLRGRLARMGVGAESLQWPRGPCQPLTLVEAPEEGKKPAQGERTPSTAHARAVSPQVPKARSGPENQACLRTPRVFPLSALLSPRGNNLFLLPLLLGKILGLSTLTPE